MAPAGGGSRCAARGLRALRLRPGLELGLHRVRPLRVDLPRRVLALPQHLVAPVVPEAHVLGAHHDLLGEVRRDEGQPLGVAQDHVAGEDGHAPDADGHVDPDEGRVGDRGRVEVADEAVEALDLLDAGEVPHGAVDHDALLRLGVDGGAEVVPDEGPVLDLAVEVHHQDVAGLEGVDHPRVLSPGHPLLRGRRLVDRPVEVRAQRHEHRGHHAPDQPTPGGAGVDLLPAALELRLVAGLGQDAPRLLGGDRLHALEEPVGHLRPPVREPLPRPLRRDGGPLLAREHAELGRGAAGDDAQHGHEPRALQVVHHQPPSLVRGKVSTRAARPAVATRARF